MRNERSLRYFRNVDNSQRSLGNNFLSVLQTFILTIYVISIQITDHWRNSGHFTKTAMLVKFKLF